MDSELYGYLPDGKEVSRFTITNKNGVSLSAINYGGIITSIMTPDKEGKFGNILFSYDTLEQYLADTSYVGAVIGRCANRIAGASFILDGKQINLTKNEGNNSLHGGRKGFNTKWWHIQEKHVREGNALRLTATSFDGEEGYPGKLNIEFLYIITDSDELIIRSNATCNKKTIVNLTNHLYFNLSAGCDATVENHLLQVKTNYFLHLNEQKIPDGDFVSVEGTPLDFRKQKTIREGLDLSYEQIAVTEGIDHCFLVPTAKDYVVHYEDATSGRILEITTQEPGIQIYSGNFLSRQKYGAIAFEPQHFPDAVHHKNFPTIELRPGQLFSSETVYSFKVRTN
jgi:aldose 1-epimerase